jgi:hypothetical protein
MKCAAFHNTPRFWNCLILCIFLVLTFPGDFSSVKPGLDPSWVYALNVLPHTAFLFGRDVMYVYGPLGFLLGPLHVGSNLLIATGFRLFIHAIFAACILYLALRASSVLPMILFAAGYLISLVAVIDLDYSYQLIIVESLLVLLAFRSRQPWWFATPAAGVLAVSLLFMKFGVGILALSVYAAAALYWVLAKPHGALKVAGIAIGSYFVTFVALAALFLQSIPNVAAWISRSMDMSDSHQSAFSIGGSRLFLLLALASAMVYALVILCFFRWKSGLRCVLLVFVPAIFLAFKHGLIRADGHERNFFPFVLALLSVLVLFVASRRELLTLITAFCLVLTFSLPVGIYYSRQSRLPSPLDTLLGKRGLSNLISTVDFRRTQRTLDLQSAANLRTNQLPEDWIDDIQGHRWTVDSVPWELTYIFANHLNWDPQPTLQTFMASTPALDEWSAQHFNSNNGPDVLIAEFTAIDGRNLLLDSPAVTRSILRNYEPYRENVRDNLFLLKRRQKALTEDSVTLGEQEIHNGEWMDVPESDHAVLAHLELSISFFGRAVKTLYRIPGVNVDLIYQSGQQHSYRITPANAKDGLLLNYLPRTPSELSDLLHDRPFDRVVKMRLSGSGMKYYKPTVHLRWELANELTFLPQLSAADTESARALDLGPEIEEKPCLPAAWCDHVLDFRSGDIRSHSAKGSALSGIEAVIHLAAFVGAAG